MAAPKGNKFSPGRPKGKVSQHTATIKAMIEGALDRLGGEAWLVEKARENPGPFLQLVGKTLPLQVNQQVDGKLEITWQES